MRNLATLLCTLIFVATIASSEPSKAVIRDHLTASVSKLGFIPQFRITNTVVTSSGAQVVYGVQTHLGIDVFNSNFVIAMNQNEVLKVSQDFIVNIENLIQSKQFGLSASEALNILVKAKTKVAISDLQEFSPGFYELQNSVLSDETIKIRKIWVLVGNVVIPSYDVSLYEKNHKHWFNTRIDASNGSILNQNDWVVSCQTHSFQKTKITHLPYAPLQTSISKKDKMTTNSSYTVFSRPIESPNHGGRSTVLNPDDVDASPFGWHDTNGATGPEYSITRGNNVYASEDKDDDNIPGTSPCRQCRSYFPRE